jgi:hypothetical protein
MDFPFRRLDFRFGRLGSMQARFLFGISRKSMFRQTLHLLQTSEVKSVEAEATEGKRCLGSPLVHKLYRHSLVLLCSDLG